jgi:hypothetical protein
MKSIHAFALACLLPLTILTAVGIAAATSIPRHVDQPAKLAVQATAEAGVRGAQDPAAAPGRDAASATAQGEDMHHHMELMQAGMKEMRRMLGKNEQKVELLALVTKLQLSARACFDLVPAQATPIDDPSALAEWRIGYVRRMVEVYDALLQLELAVHKGDAEKAKEMYKKLGEHKQSGHDAYQAE